MDSSHTSTAHPAAVQEKSSKAVSDYLKQKGKDEQLRVLRERKRPLNLLDLPVDILQMIAKEFTHTTDLTALALTHSAFYNLAIPLIYSRFDIVWPEPQSGGSEGKSVDALTYGLSTLCLGSSFAHTIHKSHGKYYNSSGLTKLTDNNYAKYCRKFSLGNGPPEWVSDYHISKESGRMLGILVAMAIRKMKNLETFIWDMPTGVLSEVFMALASLGGPSGKETSLNRVWVRWHDNSDIYGNGEYDPNEEATTTALVPPGSQLTPVGILVPPEADLPVRLEPIKYSEYRCEYPTFSCLPPLKSLTVLDIDEIGYLDEMATLIETSKDTLQELRVGIALRAVGRDFAQTWDGPNLKQVDHEARWPGESRIGERRLGGVLGVLVGKIYDIRKHRQRKKPATGPAPTINGTTVPASTTLAAHTLSTDDNEDKENDVPASAEIATSLPNGDLLAKPRSSEATSSKPCPERKLLDGKLKLHTLELERVALSLQVCRHAFDWSVLTSLTLLGCAQHDSLWKMLRKQFQPTPVNVDLNGQPSRSNGPLQYHLALKHIHTDTTTLSLINFIRDTLAPNTLEVLFLQDRRRATHPVDIDIIFKGAIKKHYASLKKLLLDCSALPNQTAATDSSSIRWRRWIPSTEMVRYITSGRMANLRELAICLDYRDWHFFLQRLPNIPQLRSLHIPQVNEYPHILPDRSCFEPKELALQVLDIITLRPEVSLCYVGIAHKCFEILEYRDNGGRKRKGKSSKNGVSGDNVAPVSLGQDGSATSSTNPADTPTTEQYDSDDDDSDDLLMNDEQEEEDENGEFVDEDSDEDDDEEISDEDDDDDADDEDEESEAESTVASDPSELGGGGQEDDGTGASDDDDGFVDPSKGRLRFKLREILFYDDKVAIFKARHGKL